jgi:hypothetical protein
MVEMGWRSDGHGIDAELQQAFDIVERRAAQRMCDELAVRRLGIDDPDQFDVSTFGKYAGVIAPHHADADNSDPQSTARVPLRGLCHSPA